jgi:hypothetical protein
MLLVGIREKRRKAQKMLAVLAFLLVLVEGITACGGGGASKGCTVTSVAGTTPGTYTATITATAGTISKTATMTITVN